ncbi:MAG: hypothetical protein ASARMPRED_004965 [Alectoria sarmentosa]|nr:MAG: hypothetical protein ASARMPRED_004965 [Alectoria sarmentosa]
MVNNPVGEHVIRTSIVFGVIDSVAVALRLLARWRSNAAFAADDVLIIASLIPLYAMIFIGHYGVEAGGLGLSTAVNLELGHGTSRISTLLKLMMSGIVTYTLTITMVKISILVLYRRIFSTAAFKRSTLIVGAAVMLWFFVALFTDLFQCHPFQAAFDPELLFTNQCVNLQAYYWGIAGSNLCIDIVMLYMPLHMVGGLKLPTRQKIALSGVFLLGGIVCVASAMRIVTIRIIQAEDMTYTLAKGYLWSQLEPAMAILCACLVTLRPLFVNLNLKIPKSSSRLGRSKTMSPSKVTKSPYMNNQRGLHLPWPGTPKSRRSESTRPGNKGNTTTDDLHIVENDLEAMDRQTSYTQIPNSRSRYSCDALDQQLSSKSKYEYPSSPTTEDGHVLVDPFR